MVERQTEDLRVPGSNPGDHHMGEWPSGQRQRTVNAPVIPAVVQIHFLPPEQRALLSPRQESFPLAFWGENRRKYWKTGAEAVVETVSAPVFCFAESKMTGYYLGFFAEQRVWRNYG